MNKSTILSVDINASVEKVFQFVSSPMNWPQYAIVNLKSVKPGTDGWFKTITQFGEGELKVHAVKEYGIFDHQWKDSQASWTVPARVVPNQNGSTVMMTLFQPAFMAEQQFDDAMKDITLELETLKTILEK